MSVVIHGVVIDSPAGRAGLAAGDLLVSVNGHEIHDVLDYQFYITEKRLLIIYLDASGKPQKVRIRKEEYEDLGLTFDTYLMDEQRHCKNHCIFCFIDQMPKGMRDSLYFKDDDARLGFLFGNYITLTNISEKEIDRIIAMKISPVNISVHTTNPELRVQMMKNPKAGESLRFLYKLAEAGISINCQLVLCPGINDGDELRRSLQDLGALYPSVRTISCVPVGLTDHREGLFAISPYTREQAKEIIDIIHTFAEDFYRQHQVRLAYPSDEFFLKAELPLPDDTYYGDYDQLENGVGLMTLLKQEFSSALAQLEESDAAVEISMATGYAAYGLICELANMAMQKWPNLQCHIYAIRNDFFGKNITVAGLITGIDLLRQLQGKELGSRLLIPRCMLRSEGDCFLDDMTLEQLSSDLGVPIQPVENDGFQLLDEMTVCNTEG